MNLRIDLPTKIVDLYQLKDYEYSAPFNIYKQKIEEISLFYLFDFSFVQKGPNSYPV